MRVLRDAKAGKLCLIEGYAKESSLQFKRRLLELGLTPGQNVKVVRKSLLGKTVLVEIRGYMLSLRKDLLSFILVRE